MMTKKKKVIKKSLKGKTKKIKESLSSKKKNLQSAVTGKKSKLTQVSSKQKKAKAKAKKVAPSKKLQKEFHGAGRVVKRKSKEAVVEVIKETPSRKKSGLSPEDLDYFKRMLIEKKNRIIERARDTINEGMKLDEAELPDEYDMASSEYLHYFTLRLRGRERYFLDKIEKALQRIEEGNFGICEVCGEEIGMARLMARPETTLCIKCKETQEREEHQFSD